MKQAKIQVNKMTEITMIWITSNRYECDIAVLGTVDEFKKWVVKRLFGSEQPDESFIKGAKMVNWEGIFRAAKKSVDAL